MSAAERSYDRILVRSPNWIGDQVLAYPFFHYLREAFPRAHIAALCAPWVEAIQFRNLVNEVIPLPRKVSAGWRAKIENLEEGARAARARGPWDLGISLPDSFGAAWQVFRAGARERWGYAADARGFLLTRRLESEKVPFHRGEAYLKLLPESRRPQHPASEFWGVPPENDLDPGLKGVLGEFPAQQAWPGFEPMEIPAEKYWVLAPGSAADSRRWPVERFASLARRIVSETGLRGVVVGGVSEAPLADELCSDRSLKLLDRTAQGAVPVLHRLFQKAEFTVANDSGLAHVAALCGSPVQVVWGAGDPKRTRPLGPGRVRVLFSPIECWPCERNRCERKNGKLNECLTALSPEAVWNEIQSGILKLKGLA